MMKALPMKAPTFPIKLNRQLSGGKEPHLLQGNTREREGHGIKE